MNISDVISLAKNAELKQLAVSESEDDTAILGFLNLGVLEIHKRFPLIQSKAVITVVEGKTLYSLDGTDTDVTVNLSRNSLLMVDEVHDENSNELGLNDEEDCFGVFTPEYNVIEIPSGTLEFTKTITVVYRAAPNFYTTESTTISLPPQFLECLLHYIGYRGHSSLRGDTKFENNAHYIRFEKSIATIESKGLFTEESLASNKFEKRGFV